MDTKGIGAAGPAGTSIVTASCLRLDADIARRCQGLARCTWLDQDIRGLPANTREDPMAGTTPTPTDPTPERTADPRFTLGLILDVLKVLEAHGYERFDGPRFVELQQHLFCLLHGGPDDGCSGRSLARVEAQR
jgi:hypothetical protein